MPVSVNADNFEAEVLGADVPVLVDFYSERCAPCRLLRPVLEGLAGEYAGRLKLCLFNIEREPGESDADYEDKFRVLLTCGVMNLPTLLLFAGGAPRRTLVGLHSREDLLEILREEGLAPPPGQGAGEAPGE